MQRMKQLIDQIDYGKIRIGEENMFRTIFALLFAFLFLVLGIPVLGIEYLIGRKNKEKADLQSLRIVQWAFRVICRICGTTVTVNGHENVPANRPVLYVCNHKSYFDIIITYSLCENLTGYIAKDDLEKVPLLSAWMKRLYCLFLKRDDLRAGLNTIKTACSYIKQGVSICIFPEGTRNPGDTLLPFKEGSLKIADKTGCPIIPVAITNTADIIKDHMPRVKPTHVTVTYGEPIDPTVLTKEEKRSLGHMTQERIQAMLDAQKIPVS